MTWKSTTWCLRTQDTPFPTPTVYAHTTHKHTQLPVEGMTRSRTSKHTQPTKPKHAEHQAKSAKACPSSRPFSKETIKLKNRRLYQDKSHQLHQTFHLNLIQPADSNVCALHRGHTHPGGAADGDWHRSWVTRTTSSNHTNSHTHPSSTIKDHLHLITKPPSHEYLNHQLHI